MVKKWLESFIQKTNQKEIRIEKIIKRKGDQLDVKWKGFPEPNKPFGGDINVKVDLSNYAPKTDLKKHQELINLI